MRKIFTFKIIDYYITKEVLHPFIIGVVIVSVIILSNYLFQLTDLIIIKNVPVILVLKLLLYKLPDIIVQTFSIALLFATITGMGRLNRENEFAALRMGGISIYRLIVPLLVLGVVISGFTYIINEEIIPWSNHMAQNIIRQTILQEAMLDVKENLFFKGPRGRLFYVEDFNEQKNTLTNIVIYNFPEKGGYPEIITASSGLILGNKWQLTGGIIHKYEDGGHLTLETQFDKMEIELARDTSKFFGEQRTPSEMSMEELKRQINLFQKSGISVNSLLVEYYLKISMPLIALIFILIGIPLSLTNKDSKTMSIIMTIIIIFLYYLMTSLCRSFGKNGFLPPVIAAWMPNLFFAFIGIILLLWLNSWQNIFQRLWPSFLVICLISLCFIPGVVIAGNKQEIIHLESEQLNYKDGLIEIKGNINGKYEKFYFWSEKVVVYLENGEKKVFNNPKKIEMKPGDISGCDEEVPHYMFRAQKVNIYPGEYIEAFHVVFRELKGKLPLFYWPYLYISLKQEEQQFVPRFGYSEKRGWFIKTTYYYSLQHFLPTEIYLDHYTKSGSAAGAKQFCLYGPDEKGYVLLYGQQNKTNLPDLFQWQGEIAYQNESWFLSPVTVFTYEQFKDHYEFTGDIGLENEQKSQNISLDSLYKKEGYYQDDYYDRKILDLNLDYEKEFSDIIDINLQYVLDREVEGQEDEVKSEEGFNLDLHYYQFKNLNIYLDYDYEKFLDNDDELTQEYERELDLNYRWGNNWYTDLNFDQGVLLELNEPEQTRWGGKGSLKKRIKNMKFELLLERYAPYFDEEDKVRFYRWPEFNFNYDPRGDFEYYLHLGNYYEYDTDIEAYRGGGEIVYDKYWNITNNNRLRIEQELAGYLYKPGTELNYNNGFVGQMAYNSEFGLTSNLTDHLTLRNDLQVQFARGETPFEFDRLEKERILESKLNYDRQRFGFSVESGIDYQAVEYLPLTALLLLRPTSKWNMGLGTTYNLNTNEYEKDLIFTSRYKDKKMEAKTVVKYGLNESELHILENKLTYEMPGDRGWYLENNVSFDYEKNEGERLKRANLVLKKKLHCRELWFSYNYLKKEFTVSYHINLFPEQGIKIGSSEDRSFIFEMGVKEMLEAEDD